MKSLLQILLFPALFVGLFGSCSEKIEPTPTTYSQLLTGTQKKSWRLVSFQTIDQGRSGGVTLAQNQYAPCIADDLYTFYANDERRFEISEGATKCDAADDDVFLTDNWTLINADASLEFTLLSHIVSGKFPWTIKNLTAQVLTIEYYIPDINASYRFTFNATPTK